MDLLVTISYDIQQRLHIAPRGWNLDCCFFFFLHRFNAITGTSSALRFVAHSIYTTIMWKHNNMFSSSVKHQQALSSSTNRLQNQNRHLVLHYKTRTKHKSPLRSGSAIKMKPQARNYRLKTNSSQSHHSNVTSLVFRQATV